MPNAVEALCSLFDCEPPDLRALLMGDDKESREKAVKFLKSKSLRTNYKSRRTCGRRDHKVVCTDLTPLDASEMYAYEGILEIRLRQHYFAAHKIWLHHHQLPCIEESHDNGHASYYPLEMVNVTEPPTKRRREPKNAARRRRRPKRSATPCSLSSEHTDRGLYVCGLGDLYDDCW